MDFFEPLRRKIGVFTLVMACVLTAAWVRSLSVRDHFDFPGKSNMTISLSSEKGGFQWNEHRLYVMHLRMPLKLVTTEEMEKLAEEEQTAEPNFFSPVVIIGNNDVTRDWQVLGFEVHEEALDAAGYGTLRRITIPYWSIVVPLTLLSAWLLLSKPRVAKPSTKST